MATRATDSPTPPEGPTMKLRPLLLLAMLAACGGAAPTPAQSADVDAYRDEQAACVAKYSTKPEIDACRAKVRADHGRPVRPVSP